VLNSSGTGINWKNSIGDNIVKWSDKGNDSFITIGEYPVYDPVYLPKPMTINIGEVRGYIRTTTNIKGDVSMGHVDSRVSVDNGNTTLYGNIRLGGTAADNSIIYLLGEIRDSEGNFGTDKQYLGSIGSTSKVRWQSLPSPVTPPSRVSNTFVYTTTTSGTSISFSPAPTSTNLSAIVYIAFVAPSGTNVGSANKVGREFLLPTAVSAGFELHVTNLSGADWTFTNNRSNGKIIRRTTTALSGASSSVVLSSGTISQLFTYIGSIDSMPSWTCDV
jgi:hypothetical protein